MNLDAFCLSDCDLAHFLHSEIDAAEEASILAHLDQCLDCRQRLEAHAAGPGEWKVVALSLRDSPPHCRSGTLANEQYSSASDHVDVPLEILSYLAPTDDPRMLGRLGLYEIVGVIGLGGMGVVLKGYDRALNRFVAIKCLAPTLALNATARQRFARESRAAAAVIHEHVIAIHSVSEHCGLPYLVMPYLSGPSLARRIKRDGALGVLEVLRIGRQIALGLAAAHKQGLVHRDVKPANILLEGDVERVTIADFGLARAIDDVTITQSGVIAGTPQFMSPEQSRAEAVDPRSDLFSLGSVMYAMCTGLPPFRGDSTMLVLRRICDDEPAPICKLNPEIPQWLCEIIEKLHRKTPSERFETAEEVANLLEAWLVHLQRPGQHPAPGRVRSRRRSAMVKRWIRGYFCVPGLLVIALGIGWMGGQGFFRAEFDPIGNRPVTPVERLVNSANGSHLAMPVQLLAIRALSFSPDGKWLVAGLGNQNHRSHPGPGSVQFWNVLERRMTQTINEPRGVNSIAISPDGRFLAYGTFENFVKICRLPEGDEIHRIHAEDGASVAFSSDGLLAIATHPRVVELWDVASWTRRNLDFETDFPPWQLMSVAFSPDNSLVAVGGGVFPPRAIYGQTVAWEVDTGKRVLLAKAKAAFMHIEFSPDGKHLATASLDTKATLWDVSSGKEAFTYADPECGLSRVRFLDDGNRVATLGPGSGIALFRSGERAPEARLRFDVARVEEICVAPDGRTIACGGTDGVVRVWDTETRSPIMEVTAFESTTSRDRG